MAIQPKTGALNIYQLITKIAPFRTISKHPTITKLSPTETKPNPMPAGFRPHTFLRQPEFNMGLNNFSMTDSEKLDDILAELRDIKAIVADLSELAKETDFPHYIHIPKVGTPCPHTMPSRSTLWELIEQGKIRTKTYRGTEEGRCRRIIVDSSLQAYMAKLPTE